MRKHDVRKWLHAILDLLPVILIPIFMVYSHRHTIDSYEVQYAQNEVVDFNQLYVLNDTTSNETFNFSSNNQYVTIEFLSSGFYTFYLNDDLENNHKYYVRFNEYEQNTTPIISLRYLIYDNDTWGYYLLSNQVAYFTYSNTATNFGLMFDARSDFYSGSYPLNISCYVNIFDLTQMFGAGNEPSIEQFESYFPNDNYAYTTSKIMLLKDVDTITYNDNDIGSQVMYCLYNTVDKYFNLNNVFNFQNVYDWFILNIFGGNAPLIVPIVWNIILYEFIMDILFITYAVFMFIIDFTEHFMESCFTKSYRGGTRK